MTVSIPPEAVHLASLKNELRTLSDWLSTEALPLWSDRGVDRRNGGYYEKLTQDGVGVEEPRRTRLVARQIYVFATAGEFGWQDAPTSRALVEHGLDFLLTKCFAGPGPVRSAVGPNGEPLRPDFDLYDHAFALFALATAAQLGHRPSIAREVGSRLVETMIAGWKHPIAGFEEAMPSREPLNASPHMHLLEAFLAWEAVDDSACWRELADDIAHLALTTFIDPKTGGILEHFNHSWNRADGEVGRFLEPGHQFEWAWLLWHWAVARGREDVFPVVRRLTTVGESCGISERTRLAINGIWDDLSARELRSRLWPQTERLKANLALAELSAGQESELALKQAIEAAAGLRRYFGTSVAGLWHETLDDWGRPVRGPVRASSLYHIVGAVSALTRFVARHDTDD